MVRRTRQDHASDAVPGQPGGDVGTGLGAMSCDGCLGVYDQDHDLIRRDQEG